MDSVRILHIETATNVCSVALSEGEKLIALRESDEDKSHGALLTIFMDEVLKEGAFKATDMHAISVSKGPGSYTGLRIGTSTAKGLCYSLDIPLIGINTLEAMANSLAGFYKDHLLCPMIDARRMEVYYTIMDTSQNVIEPTQSMIVEEDSLSEILKNNLVVFFGNGSTKCKPNFSKHSNAIFVDSIYPTAKSIGMLALDKFRSDDFEDLAYFEPFYLKEFLATKAKKLL